MKKYFPAFLIGLVVFSAGCKKSEDPTPANKPTYFVISSNQLFDGHVSTFSDGVLIPRAFKVSQVPYEDRISDAVIAGDKMYAVKSISTSIDVISLSDMSLAKSIPFTKMISGNYYRHIEFANNKIIVTDRSFISVKSGPPDNGSFLRIINVDNNNVDSVFIVKNGAIWALAQANNKIFVSRQVANENSILVLDASNYSVIADINTGFALCGNFLIDKNNNLVVLLTSGKIMQINTTDLSIMKTATLLNYQFNRTSASTTNSKSACIDKDANVIYFFGLAAQPAPAPFILKSYDLTTEAVTVLSDFIGASTISFDTKNKLLLMGDFAKLGSQGGTVKAYTTKGILSSQFEVLTLPSDILVK